MFTNSSMKPDLTFRAQARDVTSVRGFGDWTKRAYASMRSLKRYTHNNAFAWGPHSQSLVPGWTISRTRVGARNQPRSTLLTKHLLHARALSPKSA